MSLFEIEVASYGVPPLTNEQRDQLAAFAVNEIETDAVEGGHRLKWGCYPIVSQEALGLIPDIKIRRVVDNSSTKSLVAFGQRNNTIVNERCSVAVAGLGLLTVTTVCAKLDLCTEELQRMLDEGWRILAICVQPDQRRPDYVLGRSEP